MEGKKESEEEGERRKNKEGGMKEDFSLLPADDYK